MNALIMNGADSSGEPEIISHSQELLEKELEMKGWSVTSMNLSEKSIAPCCGRFFCWIKTPGTCVIKDDQSEVIQHLVKSDLFIFLTPVIFGGYSSQLKKALDRMLPILLPFFIKINGEIHHPLRYPKKRKIIVLGSIKTPNPRIEEIFHDLVNRNALNMHIQEMKTSIFSENTGDAELKKRIKFLINNMEVSQ